MKCVLYCIVTKQIRIFNCLFHERMSQIPLLIIEKLLYSTGEYSLSRHGSGRFIRESHSSPRQYDDGQDVEVIPGEEYYVERR